MKKRRFTFAERYAVWHCHGHRCWFCREPLRLEEVTIDHFIPESLLENDSQRRLVLNEHGLTDAFDINGFNNWLPCHGRCNQAKGSKTFGFVPGNMLVLDELLKKAPEVEKTARDVSANVSKDKLFAGLFSALERDAITIVDLRELLAKLVEEPAPITLPEDIILLEGGYWIHRKDIAREGECRCERKTCVGTDKKVYCYFRPDLSPWVIRSGLYWKCYDEVIGCPRCSDNHKRGHIGKEGVCGRPFRDQLSQTD